MRVRDFVILCLVAGIAGCGGGSGRPELVLHPVSGTVTLNGEPAAGVSVTFLPDDGGGAVQDTVAGVTDASGQFTLNVRDGEEGAPAGKYRVLFTKLVKPDGSPVGPDEMAADVGAENALPDIYNNPLETPISAEVPEGGKTFEFELKGR
jgi:hypothetical protein